MLKKRQYLTLFNDMKSVKNLQAIQIPFLILGVTELNWNTSKEILG